MQDMRSIVTQALQGAGRPGENKLKRIASAEKRDRQRRDDAYWDMRVTMQRADDHETMCRWYGKVN